jgi:hypothetical protein
MKPSINPACGKIIKMKLFWSILTPIVASVDVSNNESTEK